VAAAAPGTTPTGCTGERPPQFELVMFFERSKVPATVQDLTVTGATPPAAAGTDQPGGNASGGVTTPPADPAESGSGTATTTSAPQGGGS
jgi:hypothetical protein